MKLQEKKLTKQNSKMPFFGVSNKDIHDLFINYELVTGNKPNN